MRGNTFVTTRGDQISRPHGRRPQQGWIGGCQGHSSLDAPSELNPPQRIPSPLLLHY